MSELTTFLEQDLLKCQLLERQLFLGESHL